MTKVLLVINDEDQNVKISRMKVKQLKKAMKKIQGVIDELQNNESTSELIDYFLEMDNPIEGEDDLKEAVEGKGLEDKMFLEKMLGAFGILFNKLPDDITEIIAIVSGIDEELIDDQEYDVLFDIVEACIEENDIKSIIDRAKNAFFTARSKWGGVKALKSVQ